MMAISEAYKLLKSINPDQAKLLYCLELLCKEHGYIHGMIIANFRDLESGTKALAEIQELIEQLKERLI